MVTIRDVAMQAGVSTATVSRVLNGTKSAIAISDTTRQKVIAAAKELGYEPNYMAKGLAGQTSNTIGLVMSELAHVLHPSFSQIIYGIVTVLGGLSYDLLLLPIKQKPAKSWDVPLSIGSYYRQRRVAGLIIATHSVSSEEILELHKQGCPLVCVGSYIPNVEVPAVYGDIDEGVGLLVKHLLELGHRRVAFINGREGLRRNAAMGQGYRKMLESAGAFDGKLLVHSDFTFETTQRRVTELMSLEKPPTAIIAADDLMAGHVITVARELGMSIPEDLSVAGVGDLPVAMSMNPPLTTLHISRKDEAIRATELLIAKLSGEKDLDWHQVLSTKVIVRESTAKPRA